MDGKRRGTFLAAAGTPALACSSTVAAADYAHEVQAEKMSFAWTFSGNKLDVKLTAATTGWVGIGFDPTDGMQGGNYILGYVKDGKVIQSDDCGDSSLSHKSAGQLGGGADGQDGSAGGLCRGNCRSPACFPAPAAVPGRCRRQPEVVFIGIRI